ncbi:IS3 family transposase [Salmonella enterica subsp. enterica serovar Virchow]|nr:IS3 family transposase [Salmonella enterica subsp. enterica serovar Virchow]ECN9526959.1 IS3 family transposase [Salmonella enterica subsp. enterica serovar Virchow]EDD3801406.1 IS3 family transposase [Salmonella enterica subsp. enterica serovar Virchow]
MMRVPIRFFIQIRAGNTVIDGTSISYESLASSKVCPAKATALIMPVQNFFFGTLKSESFYTSKFKDIDELKIAIEDYIRYYNTRRISLRFNGLSPVEYRLKSYPGRN